MWCSSSRCCPVLARRAILFRGPASVRVEVPSRGSKASKRRKDDQRLTSPHLSSRRTDKKRASFKALAHFDNHYTKVFGSRWPSARLALLTPPPKRCALLNNFAGDPDGTAAGLRETGCLSLKEEVEEEMNRAAADAGEALRERESPVPLPRKSPVQDETPKRPKLEETELPSMPLDQETQKRIIPKDEAVLMGRNISVAMHDFVPVKSLHGMEDYVDEGTYYDSYERVEDPESGFRVRVEPAAPIHYPGALDALFYPSSNLTRFPHPKSTVLGTQNYYCMDLASLLPVAALGLRRGDSLLDTCSGPGGKALAAAQTLLPDSILCVDHSKERLGRVAAVMDQYLRGVGDMRERVTFKKRNAVELPFEYMATFDKVLCDVPCFTDRTVIREDDNNIFGSGKAFERHTLPELQSDLLQAAMKCCRPGGSVVYSTCTLSPTQNDSVVHRALRYFWEETHTDFVVNDLTGVLRPFRRFMNLVGEEECGSMLRFGQLVMPSIVNNFGPIYVAQLTRLN